MKKIISLVLMTLVVFMLSTTTVYAEEASDMGTPPQGQRGGRPMDDGSTPPEPPEGIDGERPERPEGFDENGTPPELPEGEEGMTPPDGEFGQGGGRRGDGMGPGGMGMVDVEELKTALDAVEDTDTRTSAQTLLEAYEAAMEAERTVMDGQSDETAMQTAREAVEAARQALEEALTALGLDISDFEAVFDGEMPDLSNAS